MSIKTLARVGESCDGWMTHSVSPATFSKAWGHIIRSAAAHDKDPEDMDNALVVNICVREKANDALEESGNFLADYYGIRFSPDRTRDWTAHGPPEECADKLRDYVGSGVKHLALRITSRDQSGQFGRIAEEVLPLVNQT